MLRNGFGRGLSLVAACCVSVVVLRFAVGCCWLLFAVCHVLCAV